MLERTGETATKATPLDKYLARKENDKSSWHKFLCSSGRVPVIQGNTYASFPITAEYARTMLIMHYPNWRKISDIIGEDNWLTKFEAFIETDDCPNFIKGDVQCAKENAAKENQAPEHEEQGSK